MKLPAPRPPGALPGGPDLTALALQASDFGLSGPTIGSYFVPGLNATARSAYYVATCLPLRTCGDFGTQDIEWSPSANQSSFTADLWTAALVAGGTPQVDLSSVGDGAQGFLAPADEGGTGSVVLSSGPLMEFIQDAGGLQSTADLKKLAQAAANYINTAGLGSYPD